MTETERCASELKDILGPSNYANLIALLANTKSSHLWVEAHPAISYEDHPIVGKNFLMLVRDEPQLVEIFQNYNRVVWRNLAGVNSRNEESEERYRELFENASDIIYTHDFEGKLISINRAVERITGYSRAEALQMKMTDIIAPEYLQLGQRMIDRPDIRRDPSQL